MKRIVLAAVLMGGMLAGCTTKNDKLNESEDMNTSLDLVQE
jgi:outer membrane murein-binding lipoprotein Lpp